MNESLVITYWRRGFDTYDISRFIGPLDGRCKPTREPDVCRVIGRFMEDRYCVRIAKARYARSVASK